MNEVALSQLLVKILERSDKEKPLLRRLKNIGMASEKLYRNTLITFPNLTIAFLTVGSVVSQYVVSNN